MTGAYSSALRTAFDGFEAARRIVVSDPAWYLAGGRERRGDRPPAAVAA